jgi:hypothetical protein
VTADHVPFNAPTMLGGAELEERLSPDEYKEPSA